MASGSPKIVYRTRILTDYNGNKHIIREKTIVDEYGKTIKIIGQREINKPKHSNKPKRYTPIKTNAMSRR